MPAAGNVGSGDVAGVVMTTEEAWFWWEMDDVLLTWIFSVGAESWLVEFVVVGNTTVKVFAMISSLPEDC